MPQKWNLLIRRQRSVTTQTVESYEAGREAQETVIKKDSPVWTALVREKR